MGIPEGLTEHHSDIQRANGGFKLNVGTTAYLATPEAAVRPPSSGLTCCAVRACPLSASSFARPQRAARTRLPKTQKHN